MISTHQQRRDCLLSNSVGCAVTAPVNLIAWNTAGGDRCIIAQIEKATPFALFVFAIISSMSALAGGSTGIYEPDNGFSLLIRHVMGGRRVPDVRYAEAGVMLQHLKAVIDTKTDATPRGPAFDELAEKSGPLRLIDIERELEFPGHVLVVRRARLKELRESLTELANSLEAESQLCADIVLFATVTILQKAGDGVREPAVAWANVPAKLMPSRTGIELLFSPRRSFDALPAGITPDALVAPDILLGAGS